MLRKFVITALAGIAGSWTMLAQTAQPKPAPSSSTSAAAAQAIPEGGMPTYVRAETPEQRKSRLGTGEDPGLNPDPKKHYWRFGKSYHIERYERRLAAYDQQDAGYVRPMAMVNFAKEIYQQNEKYVWVWINDPTPEEQQPVQPEVPVSRYNQATRDFLASVRQDFTPLSPLRSSKVIRFEEASEGLPTHGSWRNGVAVADMNGDGCPDIVAPPERAGNNVPSIFLGDCKGHWTLWKDVKYPYALDYGTVVAADFNKDGKMDLAFAVHLHGIFVWLGDGKGHFTAVEEGLPRDFPTRRLAVVDVDGDGYPDIVAISEGLPAGESRSEYAKGRVYLNRKKGHAWEGMNLMDVSKSFGGDWLAVGDFNGDHRPDFAVSSIYFNGQDILYLSSGPRKWKSVTSDGRTIPSLSYYFANAAGKFTTRKRDDIVVSYVHFWPDDLDPLLVPKPPLEQVVNVDLISFPDGEIKRTPIMRWGSSTGVWGMASGDFDGDGNVDVMFTRVDPREAVLLLGDGKGEFFRAGTEGLKVAPQTNYEVKVADVNGDGRPDIILMYESASTTSLSPRDGSIRVFLNRGVVPVPKTAEAK